MRIQSQSFFLSVSSIALLGAGLYASQAQAAGFYIQEQSVSGLGSAFAGSVTNIQDPSTIYFNPAGMTKLPGTHGQAAVHVIIPNAELSDRGSTQNALIGGGGPISGGDGGNPYEPSPVPNGFYSHQVDDYAWIGIGITAPFGLGNEYDRDWFGRYDSIKSDLTTIDIQPSVAFKLSDSLSIGAGVNLQFADAELTSAASDLQEGLSKLKGDDWSMGYTLGVQYKPADMTTLGVSYRSAISHRVTGRTSVEGTAANDFDVAGHADLNLPNIATFGITQGLTKDFRLMGQATWFGWDEFDSITSIVDEPFTTAGGNSRAAGDVLSSIRQNYQSTWAYAGGAEYDYSERLTVRGGFQFDETPTVDEFRTSRTPDGDRTWISTGATYKYNDRLTLDMAATYIWVDEETINVTRNNTFSAVTATTVSATTEGSGPIFALGLNYKF